MSEIKKAARTDAIAAADGAVSLFERLWPALEQIDTSSGTLGSAVYWTLGELLPIVISAPADRKTRDKWLDRLRQAIQEDGVDYLWLVKERWGELCGSVEAASRCADELAGPTRASWKDRSYFGGEIMCLSCLLAAGRHQELWDLLAEAPYAPWRHRQFGMRALLREGRIDEAIQYAEASRGLNQPDQSINAACERILLDAGRADEAYRRYGLTASEVATGLATYRAILKKYPERDPRRVLEDLVALSGDCGRYFAAAKDAGLYELALRYARQGKTDPRTLSRASRDIVLKDPEFALATGRMAIERMLQGLGFEITILDVSDAFENFMGAAGVLGVTADARTEMIDLAAGASGGFKDYLLRLIHRTQAPAVRDRRGGGRVG